MRNFSLIYLQSTIEKFTKKNCVQGFLSKYQQCAIKMDMLATIGVVNDNLTFLKTTISQRKIKWNVNAIFHKLND